MLFQKCRTGERSQVGTKKRLRPKGAADQQSKNHILQKEYFSLIMLFALRGFRGGVFGFLGRGCGFAIPLNEEPSEASLLSLPLLCPSCEWQCARHLKRGRRFRVNRNCRVILIVTLLFCRWRRACALSLLQGADCSAPPTFPSVDRCFPSGSDECPPPYKCRRGGIVRNVLAYYLRPNFRSRPRPQAQEVRS